MSSNITFNGVTYSIPAEGDFNWGPDLTAYFIAIASGAFQKTGGTFTLTAEANFGATYGLKAAYLKSQGTNPSGVGIVRLANTEAVSWRNAANSANLSLVADASDNLLFNSKTVLFSGLGLIVNADVSNSAAIAYSKLNLATSIVNGDIAAAAAIAYSKLEALTVSRALQTNASTGFIEISSVTNTELGYLSGVTSAIQTQINTKAPSSSPTFTGTVTVPATITGASAQVLTLPTTTGTLALNPMTTGGDIIYGGASGVPTRLANGSAGNYLRSAGGTSAPTWGAPIGAWTSFTPTGSWSTNTTYAGFKRKVGENYEYQVYITLAGAPTSANLTITIPETIDTAKLASGTSVNNNSLGLATAFDTSATFSYGGQVSYATTTSVAVKCHVVNATYIRLGSVNQAEPFTFASGDSLSVNFTVPISGQSV